MRFLKVAYELIRDTFDGFNRDKCTRLGAALAFYTLLSLAPLLLVVIGLTGMVVGGTDVARKQVVSEFRDLSGEQGAEAINVMLDNTKSPAGGILSTVIGLVVLVVGATGVFVQLQDALNTVWHVPERQRKGWGVKSMARDYLLSFATVCGLGFLLLVSLLLGAGLSGLQEWLEARIGGGAHWLKVGNVVLSFLLAAVLFGFIFKVLPAARVSWRRVWVGAVVTALLFTLGKYLIGVYLGRAAPGSSFGAAGSLVALLVWVYYSAQLLLLGAEFTRVYAAKFGSGLRYRGAEAAPQPAVVAQPVNGQLTPTAV